MADLVDLRRLVDVATPGPWGWRGHVDGTVEIRGPGQFGPFDARIVSAVGSDPCMAIALDPDDPFGSGECVLTTAACDACRAWWKDPVRDLDYLCPRADMLGTVWINQIGHGHIVPANDYAIREVPHRDDVIDVDHPNAQLLVAARNALPVLLDVVEAAQAFTSDEWNIILRALRQRAIQSVTPGIYPEPLRKIEDLMSSLACLEES